MMKRYRRTTSAANRSTRRSMSKGRDGVEGRTGPAGDRQGRGCQQKRPAIALRRCLAERFQIAVIEDVDAQGNQEQLMNRHGKALNLRGQNVARGIGTEQSHATIMAPSSAGGVA